MFELTGFQRDLLIGAASLGRPSGRAIAELLEETTTRKEVTHGQLYPNLDALVEQGLLEKGNIDRRTNSYAVTRKGEMKINQYASWIEESVPHVQAQPSGES